MKLRTILAINEAWLRAAPSVLLSVALAVAGAWILADWLFPRCAG